MDITGGFSSQRGKIVSPTTSLRKGFVEVQVSIGSPVSHDLGLNKFAHLEIYLEGQTFPPVGLQLALWPLTADPGSAKQILNPNLAMYC